MAEVATEMPACATANCGSVRFISSVMFKLLARNFTTTRMTSQNATQKIQTLIKENPVFIASKVSTIKISRL